MRLSWAILFTFPSLLKWKLVYSFPVPFLHHIDHFSVLFHWKMQPVDKILRQQQEKTFNSCLGPFQGAKFFYWIKPIFLLLSIASHCTKKDLRQTSRSAKHNTITPSQLWQAATGDRRWNREPCCWVYPFISGSLHSALVLLLLPAWDWHFNVWE